jgi:prevent-host-death family protein
MCSFFNRENSERGEIADTESFLSLISHCENRIVIGLVRTCVFFRSFRLFRGWENLSLIGLFWNNIDKNDHFDHFDRKCYSPTMTRITASEAKTHFGALMDRAQKEPVTIESHGRPVAVVISFEDYQEQFGGAPSQQEKEQALAFLNTWSKRPPVADAEDALKGDIKAQAIWDKYTQKG